MWFLGVHWSQRTHHQACRWQKVDIPEYVLQVKCFLVFNKHIKSVFTIFRSTTCTVWQILYDKYTVRVSLKPLHMHTEDVHILLLSSALHVLVWLTLDIYSEPVVSLLWMSFITQTHLSHLIRAQIDLSARHEALSPHISQSDTRLLSFSISQETKAAVMEKNRSLSLSHCVMSSVNWPSLRSKAKSLLKASLGPLKTTVCPSKPSVSSPYLLPLLTYTLISLHPQLHSSSYWYPHLLYLHLPTLISLHSHYTHISSPPNFIMSSSPKFLLNLHLHLLTSLSTYNLIT